MDPLSNRNVLAFLRAIRLGEGTRDADGYRRIVGGRLAPSLADHPRIAVSTRYGWTSAAGAYQIMAAVPGRVRTDTWGDIQRALKLPDFSPASQDRAAVWLITRRGALLDVAAGRFAVAVDKCRKEWASLPGAGYGQHEVSLRAVRAEYMAHGGLFEPVA